MTKFFLAIVLIVVTSFTFAFGDKAKYTFTGFSEKDIQNVKLFQASRSGNRMAVFLQLLPLIHTKSNTRQLITKMSGFEIANIKTIKNLLGEPDIRLKNNTLIYTLNPSTGCKAYIELDEKLFANFCITKDCSN